LINWDAALFGICAVIMLAFSAAQNPIFSRKELDTAIAAPNHVRIVYAIPIDGEDRKLDVDGTLHGVVETMQTWMAERADGMRLRIRTTDGRPEILFVRLQFRQNTPSDAGRTRRDGDWAVSKLWDDIDAELRRRHLVRPYEILAIFYDGVFFGPCGISKRGEELERGAMLLENTRAKPVPIEARRICVPPDTPAFPVLSLPHGIGLLHEVFHALGAVPICAPDSSPGTKHIATNPRELMYERLTSRSPEWIPNEIDAHRRNYFGHGRDDCLDIAKSPFLVPR